jgi:hypothetical protein
MFPVLPFLFLSGTEAVASRILLSDVPFSSSAPEPRSSPGADFCSPESDNC